MDPCQDQCIHMSNKLSCNDKRRHLKFYKGNDPYTFQMDLTWSHHIISWFTVYAIKQYDAQQL